MRFTEKFLREAAQAIVNHDAAQAVNWWTYALRIDCEDSERVTLPIGSDLPISMQDFNDSSIPPEEWEPMSGVCGFFFACGADVNPEDMDSIESELNIDAWEDLQDYARISERKTCQLLLIAGTSSEDGGEHHEMIIHDAEKVAMWRWMDVIEDN